MKQIKEILNRLNYLFGIAAQWDIEDRHIEEFGLDEPNLNQKITRLVCRMLDHDWDYIDYSGDSDQHSYWECTDCFARKSIY